MSKLSVVVAVRSLDDIADSIRDHWTSGQEAAFAVGHDLAEARAQFPGDREFGQWVKEQGFDFSPNWGRTLRLAAENEAPVRAVLVSQLTSGKAANLDKAVREVMHPIIESDERPARRTSPPRRKYPAWWRASGVWLSRARKEDATVLRELDERVHAAMKAAGIEGDVGAPDKENQ